MKKLIVALTTTLACLGAFAQGKVNMQNNSLHLAYYDTNGNLRPADAALAGQGAKSTAMPLGVTLVMDLYGYSGTGAGTLAFISSTTFSSTTGLWSGPANIIPASAPADVPSTFQVQIRDNTFPTAAASKAGQSYYSFGQVFTMVPGGSVLYNAIWNHNSPALSTWNDGTYNMDVQANVVGSRGVMDIQVDVPEPTTFALAGLGAAALLIFRRRK